MKELNTNHVVYLGKRSRKEVKRYKQGIGTMFMEAQQALARVKENAANGESVVPMVVVYRKKIKKGVFSAAPNLLNF